MLASITPLGERGRGSMWGVTVTFFAVGAVLGGVALGALLGAAGAVAIGDRVGEDARLAIIAVVLVAALALELRARPIPGPRRQVNERWLDQLRGWVYGAGYGSQLGLGVTTIVSSAATYVALAAALLSASAIAGAAIVGSFGAVRGLTPMAAAGVRSPGALIRLHRALAQWHAPVRTAGIAVLIGALGVALVGSLA
jgi:MFS family permease